MILHRHDVCQTADMKVRTLKTHLKFASSGIFCCILSTAPVIGQSSSTSDGADTSQVKNNNFTFAQLFKLADGTMFFPSRLQVGHVKHALGLTLARPPDDVVEEFAAVVTVPLLEYHFQYGLAENLQVEGFAMSIYASNQVGAGAKWMFGHNPLMFSLGTDLGFWFGKLNNDTFDNTVTGWTAYPNLSSGYDFGHFTITLKVELNMLLAQHKKSGNVSVQKSLSTFNGGAVTIYLEQPLWKNYYVAFGIKSNFLKYYYVAWPGFPTLEQYSYIPEFYMGLIL